MFVSGNIHQYLLRPGLNNNFSIIIRDQRESNPKNFYFICFGLRVNVRGHQVDRSKQKEMKILYAVTSSCSLTTIYSGKKANLVCSTRRQFAAGSTRKPCSHLHYEEFWTAVKYHDMSAKHKCSK